MPDSYLDHLPSKDREKIRKRMRSPEAYEKLRDRVKGPEDLEKEMKRNEVMAELKFEMEQRPEMQRELKSRVEQDVREQGMEKVFDLSDASPDVQKSLEQGKFILTVASHPSTQEDGLVAIPEGNVQEKIPVTVRLGDGYAGAVLQRKGKQ